MSLPCREQLRCVLLLSVLGAIVACAREERRFHDEAPAAATALLPFGGPYRFNAYAISQGKRSFEWFNCSGCHGHGGGDSGPALMDERWIYGAGPQDIYFTIMHGRPNGMPAYSDHLTEVQVWQLVAYVSSLTGNLRRDALPSRDDHLFDKPGEQSLPAQPLVEGRLPPASRN